MSNTPDVSESPAQDSVQPRQSKVIDNSTNDATHNKSGSGSPREAVTDKSDLDGITRKVYL